MRNLVWSDNTCTVGWTSIHGLFTAEDMGWLASMQPSGHFTPTFYCEGKDKVWARVKSRTSGRVVRIEDWPAYMRLRPGDHGRFYYSFPEDEKGIALLTALRLQGMQERRCHER